MSLQTTARKFVEMCNQLKNFDVMRTMYAPDIVSVEGDGKETKGQQPVIHKSEVWQGNNTIHGEKARGPYFNGPNQFAVHFTFDITRKSTGKRETIEEVGLYTVNKDDKITREQFFYDGEH
jgi:SnoaL-like domain